jgi:hypothetical protein
MRFGIDAFPFVHQLLWQVIAPGKMIVNVIVTLCPSIDPLALDLDDLFAEAAPEVGFTVSTHAAFL